MPPLEMSLKAFTIPFPMDPISMRVTSKYSVERNNESKLLLDEPLMFRAPWSKNGYFPFTHSKSKDMSVPTTTTTTTTTTTATTTTTTSTKRRRGVTFVSVVTIHSVLHIKDFTPDEVNDTWYSRQEIRAMKQQSKQQAIQVNPSVNVHQHEQGTITTTTTTTIGHLLPLSDSTNNVNNNNNDNNNTNDDGELTSTMRGLESKTCMGSLRKKRHRIQAWKAVFLEQRRQNMEGHYDPETLADVYFEVSEPCHVAANMVAMRDARDVQFLHSTEREEEKCQDPATWEKENQPNITRTWTDDDMPPPPPPLVGGRYRSLIALHNNRIRHEQRSLTVEVA